MLHSFTGNRTKRMVGSIITTRLTNFSSSKFSFFAPPVTSIMTPMKVTNRTEVSKRVKACLYSAYEVSATSNGARFYTSDTKTKGKYLMELYWQNMLKIPMETLRKRTKTCFLGIVSYMKCFTLNLIMRSITITEARDLRTISCAVVSSGLRWYKTLLIC